MYTAYNWVQLLLAGRTREGGAGWKLPVPVTTNVFGLLSQCFASFEQCRWVQARRSYVTCSAARFGITAAYLRIVIAPLLPRHTVLSQP